GGPGLGRPPTNPRAGTARTVPAAVHPDDRQCTVPRCPQPIADQVPQNDEARPSAGLRPLAPAATTLRLRYRTRENRRSMKTFVPALVLAAALASVAAGCG